ncbi:MAG: CcmD family protein [SAR202 cluster bacterium]|nr:CcmD family protein [SAR202 cluster bacterium]
MPKRLTLLVGLVTLLVPAMLGANHTEGEEFLPFLFAVFVVTWVAFFVYAFFMTRKQADLKREIDALRESIEDGKAQ